MSLANIKATTKYQEAIQATEDIEPPAVGFAKTADYKGGLTNQVNAVIKQNNTLLYLASKQSQKLIELEEKFDRLKQKVQTIIEKEIQPADLEDSISSLAKRLDNFSISESYESLRNTRLQHIHLGIFMIRLHALHRRSTRTNALVVLRDTRWEDSRQIIATMEVDLSAGTQLVYTFPDMILSVNNFHNHVEVAIQTHGYDTWQGGENELEGMSWNLKPPEQTSVRVPSRVAVNERFNRSDCLNEARILKDEPLNKVRRSNKPGRSKRRSGEKWSTLGEPSGKWDYYVRYDAPINTTPIEEIAATGWGEEFSDDEVTPGKVTILNKSEKGSDWDDDERKSTSILRPDYQFGYPQGKGKSFSKGYGEYYNSQWTLPPAWTESGVMLVLPADLGLWSEVISRWESITINRLNNQTWSDNKAKLAFVDNLLGESEKLMWQQWRTVFPKAYSALEAIVDEPQNITSQVRQLILLEDPYRGSTDKQDRAYRDLDRITCEETKNLWSFLEVFRSKQGNIARSAVYQELDLDDNWDIVSADFDDSSVHSIAEGEGNTHQNISVMVQDTLVEEIAFMAIEEDDESDSDQEEEYYQPS
nr:hypothetical protein [Tanacetum cinerariifolium]